MGNIRDYAEQYNRLARQFLSFCLSDSGLHECGKSSGGCRELKQHFKNRNPDLFSLEDLSEQIKGENA